MDIAARLTSKGQGTVPKVVTKALGIQVGNSIIFHLEGRRAILARTPDFLEPAGCLTIPATNRKVAWDQVVKAPRSDRTTKYR